MPPRTPPTAALRPAKYASGATLNRLGRQKTQNQREARTPDGELFGLDRLADLLEREAASGQSAEELLRRLVRAVLDHQAGGLRDDATLLPVQWIGQPHRLAC
jgi:Stage II sporulation protein E (SpoIIE)